MQLISVESSLRQHFLQLGVSPHFHHPCWAPSQQHSRRGGQPPGSHLLTREERMSLRVCPGDPGSRMVQLPMMQSTFLSVEYPASHCPPAMQICPGLPLHGSLLVCRSLKSESYTSRMSANVDRLSASFQDVKRANGKFGQ